MENLLIESVENRIRETAENIQSLAADRALLAVLVQVTDVCIEALQRGNKLLFAGNGGSAADAQHMAAELISRFHYDRPGLPAFSLSTDTSVLTAIGNDYGYEQLFARQIEAIGQAGDVFFALSTSGRSPNVCKALRVARERGLATVALTGRSGGERLAGLADFRLCAPSDSTPRIQECHIVLGHNICELIERRMFPGPA